MAEALFAVLLQKFCQKGGKVSRCPFWYLSNQFLSLIALPQGMRVGSLGTEIRERMERGRVGGRERGRGGEEGGKGGVRGGEEWGEREREEEGRGKGKVRMSSIRATCTLHIHVHNVMNTQTLRKRERDKATCNSEMKG